MQTWARGRESAAPTLEEPQAGKLTDNAGWVSHAGEACSLEGGGQGELPRGGGALAAV